MALNLFKDLIPEDKQHPYYRQLKSSEIFRGEREVINNWADGFEDRDGKLIIEFQSTFNSVFWEIYLHAAFKDLGFIPNYSHKSPDFLLQTSDYCITAEAVICSHPQGYRPEWDKKSVIDRREQVDIPKILEISSSRIANALTSKFKKYKESYEGLKHVVGLPFVICLAPFDQPLFFLQNDQAIRRVLFNADMPIFRDHGNERVVFGQSEVRASYKQSGATVELGYFAKPGMEEVSGVLFSTTATISKVKALENNPSSHTVFISLRYNDKGLKPILRKQVHGEYKESLLDGLHLFVNPFASKPIDIRPFLNKGIAIHGYEPDSRKCLVNLPDGYLIQRTSYCIITRKDSDDVSEEILSIPERSVEYREFEFPKMHEKELIQVGGFSGPFVDNHMASYRGWTIIIARDSIDNDWNAQALKGEFHHLSEYLLANQREMAPYILGNEWHKTKEDALEMVCKQIDEYESK